MAKILYRSHRFSEDTMKVVRQSNAILDEYARKGFRLTLRQLYYKFVARDLFPDDRRWRWTGTRWVRDPNGTKNATPNYKWLGSIIDNGRLAGLIDWEMIEDRTRRLQTRSHFTEPQQIMSAAYESYRIDRWRRQAHRVECWIEKDALAGIFLRACRLWDVPLFSCRGYTSQSEMWRASMRLLEYQRAGQVPVIIHFGDHDPSGIDMTRDIQDRLAMFGCKLMVRRLALNMDQIQQYGPPPNPAKQTDARFKAYLDAYGSESWELDALDPEVLSDLVEQAVLRYRDEAKWKDCVEQEIEERSVLRVISDRWRDVSHYIQLEYPNTIVRCEDELEADKDYKKETGNAVD